MIPANQLDLRLHHIGFVVQNLTASMPGFVRSLGASWDGEIFVDLHQKVRVAFLVTQPGNAKVELVEPNTEDAPVVRFLKERGEALHHLCYEVDDLERSLQIMRSRGAIIAKRPKPAVAFGGRRIAWVLTAEKLLLEMLEAH